jgi:hypothetical protein
MKTAKTAVQINCVVKHATESEDFETVIYVSKILGYDGHKECVRWCKSNGLSAVDHSVDMFPPMTRGRVSDFIITSDAEQRLMEMGASAKTLQALQADVPCSD